MDKNFLAAVCNYDQHVVSAPAGPAAKAITDSCSVASYMRAQRKEPEVIKTPEDVRRVACGLFGMSRAERRSYLAHISDSQRRLLLREGKRIRDRIVDSQISYAPQLCWAIENVMAGGRQGTKILDGQAAAGTLPREVAAWYSACSRLGLGHPKAQALGRALGPYSLGAPVRGMRIQDDKALDRFLAAGKEQDAALTATVDEAIEAAVNMSDEAQARLNEVKENLQTEATDFIGSMVESVTAIIPDLVAEQAAASANAEADSILEKADATLDAEQAAAENAEDAEDATEDAFGLDADGQPVGDSIAVNVDRDGTVAISTDKASVIATDKMVATSLGDPAPAATLDRVVEDPVREALAGAETVDVDFTETMNPETFDTLEDHLTDSQRAVLDSLGDDNPGVIGRATATFRAWLTDNYAAIKEAPDSTRERLEALMNDLHAILGPLNIMLSVNNASLIYNGTEALVTFSADGMEVGTLMYSFNNNPTVTQTLLRNASEEFAIIFRSLEPAPADSAPAKPEGEDPEGGAEVSDAATPALYDTIMANIDTLVGQLDEMGAPAKKVDKYMRPWFERLSEGEVAELKEAVAALPKDHVGDADDNSLLSDEAKQEVLNKVNEEVKRRLKESGIEISDAQDAPLASWNDLIAKDKNPDYHALLTKIRSQLLDHEWENAIEQYNKHFPQWAIPDEIDIIVEKGFAELFLTLFPDIMLEDDLEELMRNIQDAAGDEEEFEVEGDVEDIEDGIIDLGKKAINKARIKIGDKIQVGQRWATVVKKKLKTFIVKFENGTYKEFKYPNKMVGVPDENDSKVMETADSAPAATVRAELLERLRALAEKRGDAAIAQIGDAMTLEEAIAHAEDVARTCESEECRAEHAQLCAWLEDYKRTKEQAPLPRVMPDIHEGARNTYDMNHNLETFTKVRNTREALDEVLRLVAKTLGLAAPVTVEQYQNGDVDEQVALAVSDSTFDTNALDLICPKLYKRKFTDSAWMVDSIDDIEEVFGVSIPDSFKGMPALVSARPIADSQIAGCGGDQTITFAYDDNRSLYVVPFAEQ